MAGRRPRHRRDDPEHGSAAPLHPRRAAHRAADGRRGGAGRAAAHRLPPPLLREARRERGLPRGHPLHRPHGLRGLHGQLAGLRPGRREAHGHPGVALRAGHTGGDGGAAADRLALHRGRHLRHGHRGLHALPAPAARPGEDPRPVRVDLRGAPPLQLQLGGRGEPRPARRLHQGHPPVPARVRGPHLPRADGPAHRQQDLHQAHRGRRRAVRWTWPISYDLTGPNLRGSGPPRDLRKDEPYCGYEGYEFEVVVGKGEFGPVGSCFDRNYVRAVEMAESAKILHQALDASRRWRRRTSTRRCPSA